MVKELRCADVFKGCAHVEHGQDIRNLIATFMSHVREIHHVTNPTPELRIQVMTAVREVHVHVE
jgi:predicted small metal-binding protein